MSDNRHISRLEAMLEESGDVWGLSMKDEEAIQYAIGRIAELERENTALRRDAESWRIMEVLIDHPQHIPELAAAIRRFKKEKP